METEGSYDALSGIIGSLICLIPTCLGFLVIGAFGALIVWVVVRQFQPKGAAALARERDAMRAEVSQRVASLRPWGSGSLVDLSTDWDANWTRLGRDLSAHGAIPALSDPKGPALVAFSVRLRGARQRQGQMLASTSAQTIYYRINPESIAIEVDGAPLGSIRSDGTLTDPAGQPIGSAIRPGGQPFMISLGTLAKLFDERERSYPAILHGQTVAQLANPPAQMINVISLSKREYAPAVDLVGIPSQEEETWLLALAVLQVAGYNLPETTWTRSGV